ncbi:MAG TPA: peptidoglycan editing factor PgeF [Pseudomonadales bacterium]|nr:peptidoglycan editing factor PgeF [Pseudomonadales bacterium]
MKIGDTIVPNWPASERVRALTTTRHGGVSTGVYASFNLAMHCGDEIARVTENREWLRTRLGVPLVVCWLKQVHGTDVVDADREYTTPPTADAALAQTPRRACAILTADCVPVLLCDRAGTMVGAAHCGWRGLAQGVLAELAQRLPTRAANLIAWLGPGIGPARYEVGRDVRDALLRSLPVSLVARALRPSRDKWLADLYELARAQLHALGIPEVYGGGFCTYEDERFYSYRRDGVTGRMATLIWLEDDAG